MNNKRLFSALSALLLTSTAWAGGGSAVMPHWAKDAYSSTHLYITNISDETITVYVDLYDQNGNRYTETSETGDNIATATFSGDPTASGGTLGAKQTGIISIKALGNYYYGGASIQWASSGDSRVDAVAWAYRSYQNGEKTNNSPPDLIWL